MKEEIVDNYTNIRSLKFLIDIWDYIDIDALNETLDGWRENMKGLATDIDYECVEIDEDGRLILKATYVVVDTGDELDDV